MFRGGAGAELFLAVCVHFAATFAELLYYTVENRSVVAYMIWRENACSHYSRYFYFSHCETIGVFNSQI